MNWINTLKVKAGLGGWLPPLIVGGIKVYRWKAAWAVVEYYFETDGIWRIQIAGSPSGWESNGLIPLDTWKYNVMKCQLLALDDGIYHPTKWWEDRVNDHKYGRKRGAKQIENFSLVEKYLNQEV